MSSSEQKNPNESESKSDFKETTSYDHADVNLCSEDWNDLFRSRMMDIIHFERKEKRSSDVVFAYFTDKMKILSPKWHKIIADDTSDRKAGTKKTTKQFFFEKISLLLQCVEHDKTDEMISQLKKIIGNSKNRANLPSIEDHSVFCTCFLYGLAKGHSNFPEKVRNSWVRLISYYCTKMRQIYEEIEKEQIKND